MVRKRSLQEPSLGVDLVELSRAKAFYRAHASRLGAYFAEEELAFLRRARRRRHERLAILLAAKEAAFKATGGVWMGPHGFRSIRLRPASRPHTLICRLEGSEPPRHFTLTYSTYPHFVLARCAGTC